MQKKKLTTLLRILKPDRRTLSAIKHYRKFFRSNFIKNAFLQYFNILNAENRNRKIQERLKGKSNYRVVFLMVYVAHWKYDSVYWMMHKSNLFTPMVVIAPLFEYGEDEMRTEMEKAVDYCKKKGYNYESGWENAGQKWIDVNELINPDIVFFNTPYRSFTHKNFHIDTFSDKLTCYVPYSIRQENAFLYAKWDTYFQNIVWRNYYESPAHLEIAKKQARNGGANVKITGHPIIDAIRTANPDPDSLWKKQQKIKKRIIWAPHWTIQGTQNTGLDWASFLLFNEVMLEIGREYADEIQIAFKPHPNLKAKLSSDKIWGKKKTEAYFKQWDQLPNGQLNGGDYVELMASSNALIHDSGSFMIEYLALNKPVLYLLNKRDITKRFNSFGDLAYRCHYKAHSKEEIKEFIENVLFKGLDGLQPERADFCNNYLSINGHTAAENIISDLEMSLKY